MVISYGGAVAETVAQEEGYAGAGEDNLRGAPGGLWRDREFGKLWAGETVSLFGTQITLLALPDLDDLAALDPGAEDDARPPSRGPHGPGAPVDERRSRKPVASREGADHGDLGELRKRPLLGTRVDKSIICGMRRIPPGESIIP
jgi:hypothetical protein